MKIITPFAAVAIALSTMPALAEAEFTPGAEFMTQWDLNGDGQVTLGEARERRESIFSMFDRDDNGVYSDAEIALIDEHKQMEREAGKGPGHGRAEQMAQGRGPGMGHGKGHGNGHGAEQAGHGGGLTTAAAEGLRRFDANRDGRITRAEFVAGTDAWFAMRDRQGDGVLTSADFGPRW